jgi:hypothetical protein
MAYIERYKTRDGRNKYRVRYRLPDGRKKSQTFSLAKDAERLRRDVERRQELGELYEEQPQTFGAFAGLKANGSAVMLTGDGWYARWAQTVQPSTYDRRCDLRRHLAALVSLQIDCISAQHVDEVVLGLSDKPRTAKMVHETIMMILKAAKVRGQRVRRDVLETASPRYEVKRPSHPVSGEDFERPQDRSIDGVTRWRANSPTRGGRRPRSRLDLYRCHLVQRKTLRTWHEDTTRQKAHPPSYGRNHRVSQTA